MKPYYSEYGITVYCGDCRDFEELLKVPGLVLMDPLYGINLQNHGKQDGRRRRGASFRIHGDENDSIGQWAVDLLQEVPLIAFASPMKPWAGSWDQHLCWDKGLAVGGQKVPYEFRYSSVDGSRYKLLILFI